MKRLFFLLLLSPLLAGAQQYKTATKTLANGLKVIVCEKPGNDFVQSELWYRVGSKDETPGIRGMAHLFEHMMFRGTKAHPGNAVFEAVDKIGGSCNAYTSYDMTVYHEYVPVSALDEIFELEADRMENLVVTQEILNTEREVVGEELRIGRNNWYSNLIAERYPLLYPQGHPYEVDVIGHLEEITSFTAEQCMKFYDSYYSPNNAFLVIVGNVKSDEVFALAEKHFGKVKKQLNIQPRKNVPDVMNAKLKQQEMPLNFPLQIYSYVNPHPAVSDPDFITWSMLNELVFVDENSILNNRLVKKDHTAFAVFSASNSWNLYAGMSVVDVAMQASPGNVKVKRAIREELNKIIEQGIPQETIDSWLKAREAEELLSSYNADALANRLGIAEYYFNDAMKGLSIVNEYRKVKPDDLKCVAAKYFAEDKMQMINIRPE